MLDLAAASATKAEIYEEIADRLYRLVEGRDPIANTANAAALIWQLLPDLNWAGFYLAKGGELVLGPFQGKPASPQIAIGRGVCGAAALWRRTVLVPDVNNFPGHISCDAASWSELAVPLLRGDSVVGVMDLDSASPARFDDRDRHGCEILAEILVAGTDF
ncbi:GAF domain-containing protein [Arenibaculum pallidiluteum]|uniref:GAF domain-containing protein n=1 Tax=Arenibaculum pallidiluteum TaxID=2812559 RepID=UPI001A960854|nr:GAF domain-containing protein [Arenibaculum pallidiluteum]